MKGYNPTPEEMQQYINLRRVASKNHSAQQLHQANQKQRPTVNEQAAIDALLNSMYNGQ